MPDKFLFFENLSCSLIFSNDLYPEVKISKKAFYNFELVPR
jgi:hypothetical protein